MTVRVLLFARAKDLAGAPSVDVALESDRTVAGLRRRLAQECPALAGLLPRSAIAVDDEFASEECVLQPNSRIALLPPVSGGG